MTTAGYSGTPLAKKLGIKPGTELLLRNAPESYQELVEPLPQDVRFVQRASATTDIAHLFVVHRTSLEIALDSLLHELRSDAVIWVSWPKKSSRVSTDITEDVIRAVALPLGLVDIKVCAVDSIWSGLKLVVRKENRKRARKPNK
jgi:hypothetical protein